jgi:hypothetical protein
MEPGRLESYVMGPGPHGCHRDVVRLTHRGFLQCKRALRGSEISRLASLLEELGHQGRALKK